MISVLFTHQRLPPLVLDTVPSIRAFQELLDAEDLIELAPLRHTRSVTAFVRPFWWRRGVAANQLAMALLGTTSNLPKLRGPVLFAGLALEGEPGTGYGDVPVNFLAYALTVQRRLRAERKSR